MARTVRFSDDEVLRAKKLRDEACTATELRRALSVILMTSYNFNSKQTAELLGASRRTIFRNRSKVRNQDDSSKRWGGRRRSVMTLEEEVEFLSTWEAEAVSGGVLSVPRIHAALTKRLGCNIAISTTYRLLARHKWRKVQPDTKHPKSDPAAQDEFKKNSRSLWLPPMKKT
jgi:transposase